VNEITVTNYEGDPNPHLHCPKDGLPAAGMWESGENRQDLPHRSFLCGNGHFYTEADVHLQLQLFPA